MGHAKNSFMGFKNEEFAFYILPSIFGQKNITMNYLLIKCNSTLLKVSSARDIHSTKTMLVSSVYFQFPQSKQNNFDCVKTIDIQQKLLVQYKLWLSWAYYQALEWLKALTRYSR